MKNAIFNSEGVAFFLPRFARQTVARSLQEEPLAGDRWNNYQSYCWPCINKNLQKQGTSSTHQDKF